MADEKCTECKNGLVLGEKSQCIYCELTQRTGNKSCPKCSKSVLRDKGSLYCELCKCFYHNACNEFPLDDQYCTLLYEVPRNIKWFCDKCVWDTEKWISDYSVNYSSDCRTDSIDTRNLDTLKDIHDQEKYTTSNNKRNKQNSKGKKGNKISKKGNKINKKGNKISNTENKDRCITKNNTLQDDIVPNHEDKNEEEKVDNMLMIKKEETNYDSTFEADDIDYHPCESDSDWESESPKKYIKKDKLKKKYPKTKNRKKKISSKYHCDQCPKSFVVEHFFEAHKLWHTGDKQPYKCDLCSECYSTKRTLDQHKMKHTGVYPFICNFCGIGKSRADYLKIHIRIKHSEEKPFSCPECDFCSRTKQKLKSHMHRTHRVLEIFKCTLCEYQTKNKQCLKYHIRDHNGENIFMCDECGQNLKTLKSLQNHQLRHTGEKPHKCKLCEKSFRLPHTLKIHQFAHTKEKNFFCPVCGFGFPQKHNLDVHLKSVHSDEKPFECETCGNKYKTKHNLKNHQIGKRGSCHPNNTQKQKIESLPKFKSSSESNMSDSNDSHLVPIKQTNQQPPLLYYAGANEKSMAPVYSNSHITATIHCPPPYLSVINYMDH